MARIGSMPEYPITDFYWCAGKLLKGNMVDQFEDEQREIVDVNFRNPLFIILPIWKAMQKCGLRCHFVVISSSSGTAAREDEAIYVATKHAQVGFARSLGKENKNSEVRVTLFMPGGMKTPFWDDNPQIDTEDFLDPKAVSYKIISDVSDQYELYKEVSIPRNSL